MDDWADQISKEDFVDTFNRHGRRGGLRLLKQTGEASNAYHAIQTTVGRELLADIIRIADSKLELIITEQAEETDYAEYRIARELLMRYSNKIAKYLRLTKQWKGE